MLNQKISEYFQNDHSRLDGLFRTYQSAKSSDFKRATRAFEEFKRGLERHILWEEELLFPLFEAKTGMRDSGPTAVMRMEHREIRESLNAIHAKNEKQDTRTDAEETSLLAVLSAHNQKEEGILYPMIDNVTSDSDREDIFKQMEKYSIPKV